MLSLSSSVNVCPLLVCIIFSPDTASCPHVTLHLVHVLKLPYYSWLLFWLQMSVMFLEALRWALQFLGKAVQTKLHTYCLHTLLSTTHLTPTSLEGSAPGEEMCQAMLQTPQLPVVHLTASFKVMQPPAETHLWGDYKWDPHTVHERPVTTQSAERSLPNPSGACQAGRPSMYSS